MLVVFIVVDADIVDGTVEVSDIVDDDINNPVNFNVDVEGIEHRGKEVIGLVSA